MLSYRQLHETATALIDAAGTSPTVNSNIAGKWRSIAEAAEELAGASTTANNSVAGYMHRAAVALESIAGTDGDEENPGTQGLLKRIVDALEVQAGDVSAGPLGARLRLAAANASFGDSLGPELVTNGPGGAYIGTFDSDTGFNFVNSATVGGGVVGFDDIAGRVRVTSHDAIVAGSTYRVTFTITEAAGMGLRPEIGGTAGTVRSALGTHTENIVAGSSGAANLIQLVNTLEGSGQADDWSVKEVM